MRLLVPLILVVVSSSGYSAAVTYTNGLESGDLATITCSGNCPTVTSEAKLTGIYSADATLTRDMATPYRTEFVFGDNGKLNFDQEYWIGYNHKFADWEYDSDTDMALQIHPAYTNSEWATTCPIGSGVVTDSFAFLTSGDRLRFITFGGIERWSQPLNHGSWQSLVFHFIPSGGVNGLIEAWVDGIKIASVAGTNTNTVDSCGHAMASPYLKLGVYKWNWTEGRPATESTRRQIYYDNIKIASGANGYGDVYTPVAAPIVDSTPPTISNLTTTATSTSCTVRWATNEGAKSEVSYGLNSEHCSLVDSVEYETQHSVLLPGLTPGTTYTYKVLVTDAAGNENSSAETTCITSSTDTISPVLTSLTATQITASTARLTWTTDEASDSRIDYGTTLGYGLFSSDAAMVTSHSIDLTGLSQNTTYNYKAKSTDPSGNFSSSGNFTFTTVFPDTAAPIISSVAVSGVTGTGATITWTTNESSDSRVDYGATTAYGSNLTNATLSTSHSISLTGLTPGATYQYKVSSKDAYGNTGQGTNLTFATLDTVAPVMNGVAAGAISETTATISWITNEASDGLLEYGPTTGYGAIASSAALTTSHSFNLTGLTSGSIYHYKATSKDAALNSSNSGDLTFTTASPADVDPPLISGVSSGNAGDTNATITWSTDEPSDSRVDFGTTLSYGGVQSAAAFVTTHSVTLTGLSQNTTYHFKVTSKDGANNSSESLDFTFTTVSVDTVPPGISTIVAAPSATGAVITWVTGEASNSAIDYGQTTGYGSTSSDPAFVTAHSITLTGLSEKTTYNFKIHSTDAAGNTGHSANLTFTTLDATAPTLSNISVSSTGTGATFTWTTDEASNSRVDYGVTTAYGSNQTNSAMVTSHSITVSGLTESTTHHYKITSADATGNSRESADLTFTTTDVTSPVISNFVATSTSTSITARWTTNEPSNTRLSFASPITSSVFDAGLVTAHEITVTGLQPSVAYTYKIQSVDAAGNPPGEILGIVTATTDPIAPNISGIVESGITYGSFTVNWNTDVASDSKIEYGFTSSYGSIASLATLETTHSIVVSSLAANTEYHYKVCSTAAAERCSADRTLVTDYVPVVTISGIGVSPAKNNAVITWTTDRGANSVVLWGTNASLSSAPITSQTAVTSHSVNITGLLPKKRYYFRVKSAPPGGEDSMSQILTFSTVSGSGLRSDKFGPP